MIGKIHSETATTTPLNNRDNHIATAKERKWPKDSKATRDHLNQVLQQRASLAFPNTPEKRHLNIISHIKMLIEDVKKHIKAPLRKYRRK